MSAKPFINIGAGDIIKKFMNMRNWSNLDLSKAMQLPMERIEKILTNKERMTKEIAECLSNIFGPSPEYWINLDKNFIQNKL